MDPKIAPKKNLKPVPFAKNGIKREKGDASAFENCI
jgi:hypothetical protein